MRISAVTVTGMLRIPLTLFKACRKQFEFTGLKQHSMQGYAFSTVTLMDKQVPATPPGHRYVYHERRLCSKGDNHLGTIKSYAAN